MVIGKKTITIEASSEAGLFYAVQSLLQLIPTESKSKSIKIKCSEINDYPRFAWRGLHLDVCRHFMPKEFVLKYLDYMALHKLNRFHFHLTEDRSANNMIICWWTKCRTPTHCSGHCSARCKRIVSCSVSVTMRNQSAVSRCRFPRTFTRLANAYPILLFSNSRRTTDPASTHRLAEPCGWQASILSGEQ